MTKPLIACLLLLAGCATVPAPAPAPALSALPVPTASPKSPVAVASVGPLAGAVSTLAGLGDAIDLAIDARDNLYVAALDGIYKRGPGGDTRQIAVVRNALSFHTDPTQVISNPECIALDPAGNVWVYTFDQLFEIAPDGTQSGHPSDGKRFPSAMAADAAGNLYTTVPGEDLIRKRGADGSWTTFAGSNQRAAAGPGLEGSGFRDGRDALFRNPQDLAFGPDGTLYVADSYNTAIRTISPDGVVHTLAGHPVTLLPSPAVGSPLPDEPAPLGAASLAIGPDGTVYTAGANNKLYRVSAAGAIAELAGDGQLACHQTCLGGCYPPSPFDCHVDGQGAAARFDDPRSLVLTSSGKLWLLDGSVFGQLYLREVG